MDDARTREIAPCQTFHTVPSPAAASPLTAAAKLPQPVTSHFVYETAEAAAVAGHGVVVQPALHDAPQPAARFAKRTVPAFPQRGFDRWQRGLNAFGHRIPRDREEKKVSGTFLIKVIAVGMALSGHPPHGPVGEE